MILVPLPITQSPSASIYFVPIQSAESMLNVNVPEFLPKNYKQLSNENADINDGHMPTTIMNDEEITITTNESTANQSETINIQTNGLSNDSVCTQNTQNKLQANTVHDSYPKIEGEKAQIEQNPATVFNTSVLLKNNSNNINVGECIFKSGNSDKQIKADLDNKQNNISKGKIFKHDDYCNDSGSNKRHKLNNSIKNAKTRHYTKTTVKSQENAWKSLTSIKFDQRTHKVQGKISEENRNVPGNEIENVTEKVIGSPGLTYAQMVVPTSVVTQNVTQQQPIKVKVESPKLPSKAKNINNAVINGHTTKVHKNKNPKQNGYERQEKLIEGAVEWFTIGAKGKKHIASDGRMAFTEIAFENELNFEKVNKIAEELQLDINKDADLAMDIMDSLAINENTQEVKKTQTANELKKKKVTSKSKKKLTKDKCYKELRQQRRDTFDIIEPSFESAKLNEENGIEVNSGYKNDEEYEEATLPVESIQIHKTIDDKFVFDPNVFATPCNLHDIQVDSGHGTLGNSLRLSTGKPTRNLINQFDIYQQNYTSPENQQLKQEEEMVIKILQQLNKSIDDNEISHKTEDVAYNKHSGNAFSGFYHQIM